MKIRDSYDWVVLGEHPGALLSAGLAARLGLSVLVVPFGQTARLSLSSNGQYLDPEANFILGIQNVDGVEALTRLCLNRLGVSEGEWEGVEGGDALFQVVSHRHRIAFGPPKFFASELKREIGNKAGVELNALSAWEKYHRDILRAWHAFPKRLTIASDKAATKAQSSRDWASLEFKRGGRNPVAQGDTSLHSALHFAINGRPWNNAVSLPFIESLAVGTTGARFKGGMTAYRELLVNLARRLGADIATKTDCRKILTDGQRVTGVQLAGRSGTIRAGGVAVGARFSEAIARLQGASKRYGKSERHSLTPTAWKFTLALTLSREAIPPGVGRRVVWVEQDAPPLEIEFARRTEFEEQDTSASNVAFLRTLMPYSSESLVPAYQRLVSARMMRKFTELFPFAEFHVKNVFPEFREQERKRGSLNLKLEKNVVVGVGEDPGNSPFAVSDLKEIPENLLVYEGKGLGTGTKLEGMFLISDESYPELGTLGGTVAALEGVSWVSHRAGLSGPFV